MQPHDDLGPVEPGLERLLGVLTSGPAPDELAGEQAALAMFRASQPGAAVPGPAGTLPFPARPDQLPPGLAGWRRLAGQRRPGGQRSARERPARRVTGGRRRTGRLAAALALALAAGFAAAAYAEILPAPVQHVAYRVLGFVGVPNSGPSPARPDGRRSSSPTRHHPGPARSQSPAPGPSSPAPRRTGTPSPSPAPSASPSPRPHRSSPAPGPVPAQLSLSATAARVVAGGGDSFTGLLTSSSGRPVPGQRLALQERAAGQPGWQPAGQATTGTTGRAALTVSDLTSNAWFRLTGPDGTQSQKVRVIAVPPVSVTVGTGPRRRAAVLTVTIPLADPGDLVVLQVRADGGWQILRAHRLGPAGQTVFQVKLRRRAQEYRVLLLRTASHGRSVSSPVLVSPAGG